MGSNHGEDCEEDCFGCKMLTVQYNPYSMPSRLHPHIPPKKNVPRWERGVPTDERGMPFLDGSLNPIGQKEFSEKRSVIEKKRRQYANAPLPMKD